MIAIITKEDTRRLWEDGGQPLSCDNNVTVKGLSHLGNPF